MLRKKLLVITSIILSIGILFGCNNNGNNEAGNNDNLTDTNMTRDVAATNNNDDNDMDWGWLGLIGLAGLLGRRRDNRKE
jgi:hypothetical protein